MKPSVTQLAEIIRKEGPFRIFMIFGVVVAAAIASPLTDRPEILWAAGLIAAIQACMLGLKVVWLRWGRHLFVLDYFTLAMDVITITLGLAFLGGVEFPFDWIYAVALVGIAITRGLKTGLFFAQWSMLCYGALLWMEYKGIWQHMALFPVFTQFPLYRNVTYVLTKFVSNTIMFNLAALNAAFFSSALQRCVEERTRELKQAQVQLMHSQKLATLGQIAASLAHGLASPITGIKGSAELLMEDLPPEHPAQQRLHQILHWSDHLADILARLRNLARPPKDERGLVDVNKILRDVLDLVSKLLSQARIQVEENLAADLPQTEASGRLLEELFMNLVMNAKDAMPEGGKLIVSSLREGDEIVVHITDTGVGMSPEVRERIFEPFFTTKGDRGSGLGLSISRQIVVDHGGRLSVESQEGKGTTFTVRLPVVPVGAM